MTLEKLPDTLSVSTPVGRIVRPTSGWLKTMREAHGLTLAQVAQQLKVTPPAVRSFEQAEAEDRITLGSLRRTADAMGCDLIYALVPRGTPKVAESQVESSANTLASAPADGAVSTKVIDLTWNAQRDEL